MGAGEARAGVGLSRVSDGCAPDAGARVGAGVGSGAGETAGAGAGMGALRAKGLRSQARAPVAGASGVGAAVDTVASVA